MSIKRNVREILGATSFFVLPFLVILVLPLFVMNITFGIILIALWLADPG